MINSLAFPKLRNTEFSQFFNALVVRCERYNLTELKLDSAVITLKDCINPLNQALQKETGSQVTEQLIASDGRRDSDLVGIRTVCEGYTYSRDPETAQAAKLLLNSIDKYGSNISRMNYQAESTVVDAIIDEWDRDPALKAALGKLRIEIWAQELKDENGNFKSIYQTRVDDKLGNNLQSFTEMRDQVTLAYRNLCDNIFAYSVISPEESYKELADAINLIIADYQALLDRRVSTKEPSASNE